MKNELRERKNIGIESTGSSHSAIPPGVVIPPGAVRAIFVSPIPGVVIPPGAVRAIFRFQSLDSVDESRDQFQLTRRRI